MANPDATYTYEPIDLGTNAIRILRLCRGYDTDPIVCELAQIFLEDDGIPYEALSYTWGNSVSPDANVTHVQTVNFTPTIILGGCKTEVKYNLHMALRCLRRSTEDRWLWVDALCIDQNHDREKTHQVGRMRHIYEKAERVLIWLGPTTEDIDLLMEMMKDLGKMTRSRKSYRRDEATAWLEEWPGFIEKRTTELKTRTRYGLVDLLRRPWFRRVWVLQETYNAKRAAILCGWNEIPTETFVITPRLMNVHIDIHVQSVLDIMPGHLRRSSWRSEEPDLRTLLKQFHRSKATYEHDKIYALLGIASDTKNGKKFQPDYSITLQDTISHAISYLVFGESSTSICPLPYWPFDDLIKYLDKLPYWVFLWAIGNQQEATVKEVLARTDVATSSPPPGKQELLMYLARNASVWPSTNAIISTILAREDVDVTIEDREWNNLLHVAVIYGHSFMVKSLLLHPKVDPRKRNYAFMTPLELAIKMDRDDIIKDFIQYAEIYIKSLLNGAMSSGLYHTHVIEVLLKHGAVLEARDTITADELPVVEAENGKLSIFGILDRRSADADVGAGFILDHFGNATRWVTGRNVFSVLLDPDLNPKWSVLHDATWRAQDRILVGIPRKSKSHYFIELQYCTRNLALFLAIEHGCSETVATLLDAGADIQARYARDGHTPLWAAIKSHKQETVKMLFERAARLEQGKNRENELGSVSFRKDHIIEVLSNAGWNMEQMEAEIQKANTPRKKIPYSGEG
jgi:hypothetical protein